MGPSWRVEGYGETTTQDLHIFELKKQGKM